MRARKTGAWVGAKVQLVRQLAVGTTSTVWLARHRDRKEPVAVKLLEGRLFRTMGPEIVRFHREAKALEQLRSAYSVRLFDHGLTADEQPYLVMELLRGQTLEARLRRDSFLPLDDVTRLVQQLTAALGEAHELGIVHRDVSADNVFLVCADRLVAKLLDFGMAKHMQSGRYAVSTSDAIRESAATVAPEMLNIGGAVDHRVDLWAVGALAYRALSGAYPFAAADYHETIRRMRACELLPIRQLGIGPELPEMLDHFFSVALAPDPSARFASAEELAAAWMWAVGEEDSVEVAPPHVSAVRLAPGLDATAAASSPRRKAKREDLAATLVVVDDDDMPVDPPVSVLTRVDAPLARASSPSRAHGGEVEHLAETQVVVDDEDDFAATRVRAVDDDDEDLIATRVRETDEDDELGGGTLIVTDAPAAPDLDDDDEPLTVVLREDPRSSTRHIAAVIDDIIASAPARPDPSKREPPLGEVPAPSSPSSIEVVDQARSLRRLASFAAIVAMLALLATVVVAVAVAAP